MVSSFILPETTLFRLSKEIIEINKLDTINKLLARGLSLQIIALQMKQLQSRTVETSQNIGYSTSDYDRFIKRLNMITNNLAVKITIDIFSKESGISKNKLQTICKNSFGVTFKKLIKDLRLEKARYMIQNLDFSISEICYDVGYASRSFFSKEFKAEFGLNPIEYKNEMYSEELSFELSYFMKIEPGMIFNSLEVHMKLLSEACESFGVSGVLIYYDKTILHIIEGSKKSVLNLFSKITKYGKYDNTNLLFKGIRKKSRFPCHEVVVINDFENELSYSSAHHFHSSIGNIIYGLDNIYLSGDLLWKRIYTLLKTSVK